MKTILINPLKRIINTNGVTMASRFPQSQLPADKKKFQRNDLLVLCRHYTGPCKLGEAVGLLDYLQSGNCGFSVN